MIVAIVFVLAFVILAGIAAVLYAAPSLRRAARDGRSALVAGAEAIAQRNATAAERSFDHARTLFDDARRRLSSPIVRSWSSVPVAGTHVEVARSLTEIGDRAARTGVSAAGVIRSLPSGLVRIERGQLDLRALRVAKRAADGAVNAAGGITRDVRRMPTGWVVGPLAEGRTIAIRRIPPAVDGLRKADAALSGLPTLFAERGRKRYLIAFSNLAELRGSGGHIGFVTVLRAERGRLRLEGVSGRPVELLPPPAESGITFPTWFPEDYRIQAGIFQNINMTADFPTVGRLAVRTASRRLGPLNGVIGIDPIGISSLLRLTGPISLAEWPEPITADNVAAVSMHDVYVKITDDVKREAFFGRLVRTAFGRFLSTNLSLTPEVVGRLASAVEGGHLRMYSTDGEDQSALTATGLAGAANRAVGGSDVLSVVTNNATGNKADWFLRRDARLRVRLDPEKRTAFDRVEVRFRNLAPSSGLPDYIIGSPIASIPRGLNRQIVEVVRAPADKISTFSIGDRRIEPVEQREGKLRAYRWPIDVPSRSSVDLRGSFVTRGAIFGSGRERTYDLRVLAQAVAHPDFYDIRIAPPKGWRVQGPTRFLGDLRGDMRFNLRLTQTWPAWAFERAILGPRDAAVRLFRRVF